MTQTLDQSPFGRNAIVIVYLHTPREKFWGLLLDLGPAGVTIRGLGLDSFEDWLRSAVSTDEQAIQPSVSFFPLARVEKILLDESTEGTPSLDAQCLARTGRSLAEALGGAVGGMTIGGAR